MGGVVAGQLISVHLPVQEELGELSAALKERSAGAEIYHRDLLTGLPVNLTRRPYAHRIETRLHHFRLHLVVLAAVIEADQGPVPRRE
jgi:hypothetical protein